MSWRRRIDLQPILAESIVTCPLTELKRSGHQRVKLVQMEALQRAVVAAIEDVLGAERAKADLTVQHQADREIQDLRDEIARLRGELALARTTADELAGIARPSPQGPPFPPPLPAPRERLRAFGFGSLDTVRPNRLGD